MAIPRQCSCFLRLLSSSLTTLRSASTGSIASRQAQSPSGVSVHAPLRDTPCSNVIRSGDSAAPAVASFKPDGDVVAGDAAISARNSWPCRRRPRAARLRACAGRAHVIGAGRRDCNSAPPPAVRHRRFDSCACRGIMAHREDRHHSASACRTSVDRNGLIHPARQVVSPNRDERPSGMLPELIVVHGISLPPDEYGGPWIDRLFTNALPPDAPRCIRSSRRSCHCRSHRIC